MTNSTDLDNLIGRTVVDVDGVKVGRINRFYLDHETGKPVWVAVRSGVFGGKENVAPIDGSHLQGDTLVLGVPKALVTKAPAVTDGSGSFDEDTLCRHYRGHLGGAPRLRDRAGTGVEYPAQDGA